MELKNSVVVDLDKYNELRDFKKNVEDNKVCITNRNAFGGNSQYYYLSHEDAIIKLTNINNDNEKIYIENISKLDKENFKLKSENEMLKSPTKEPITNNVDDLKKLSFFKLIKWYFKK